MSSVSKIDYAITTTNGSIHYVTQTSEPHFLKPRKIYIDDFLFKDSFFDKNFTVELKKYIGSEMPVLVGYRNKPKILVSKRGHYKLKEDKYNEVIKQMNAEHFFDFKTGKLIYNGNEVYEPKDIEDFNNSKECMFGTQFINDLTDKGMVIYENDGILESKHLNDTDLEYQKYMLSINEITAFTLISESNYKVFYDFINRKNNL